MHSKLAVGLVSLVFVAVGCSSSSREAPLPPMSSVEGSKPISSLSDAQAEAFCKEYEGYAARVLTEDEAHRALCAFIGAFSEGDACRKSYDECMSKPAETSEKASQCPDFKARAKTCTATVAEIEACSQSQFRALKSLAAQGSGSCSDPSAVAAAFTTSDACSVARKKCPSLYESPTGSGS